MTADFLTGQPIIQIGSEYVIGFVLGAIFILVLGYLFNYMFKNKWKETPK